MRRWERVGPRLVERTFSGQVPLRSQEFADLAPQNASDLLQWLEPERPSPWSWKEQVEARVLSLRSLYGLEAPLGE